jgi:membrane protease YdiL (CAAX protease family)
MPRLDGDGDNPLPKIKGGVMNDTSGSDPAEHAAVAQSTRSPAPTLSPWGLLATIAWSAAGLLAEFAAQFLVIAAFIRLRKVPSAEILGLANNEILLVFTTVLARPAWVGIAALAARMRGWRVRDYLALVMPRRDQILFGVTCLAMLEISFALLIWVFYGELGLVFGREEYQSARAAGALPLYLFAVVVIAPITEEIAFRGFLFRGLSESWLGVAGTVVMTSAVWALAHVQYDWVSLSEIFVSGLVLGWLRWTSGSTVLTILLHAMLNFPAIVYAAKVEWMS